MYAICFAWRVLVKVAHNIWLEKEMERVARERERERDGATAGDRLISMNAFSARQQIKNSLLLLLLLNI